MPFRSEKQRRYLWAAHPDIAKEWAHKYPESNKGLPMYVNNKKDDKKSAPTEKAATFDVLGLISPYVDSRTYTKTSILDDFPAENAKNANDKLVKVDIPHSDKPTYAGQEREEGEVEAKPSENTNIEQKNPENAINSLLQKISVVLSQPMAQLLENQKAIQEGRSPAYQPRNPGIRRYAMPTATVPPPMGSQPAPAQPQPTQQPQQPQPQQGAGMKSPSANPINSFGGLSMTGNINGNAAFGTKNSPGSSKSAGIFLRDLPPNQTDALKIPVGKGDNPFPIAEKYREPRLLLKPFYHSDRKAMQNALEMAGILDPSIMQREMLSDKPLTKHDAISIGMNLKAMYPDRFRLPPNVEKALDVQPDAYVKRRKMIQMLKDAGIYKASAAQNDFLAKVTSMDFPPHPDPEDLELDDDYDRTKTALNTGISSWAGEEKVSLSLGVAPKRKKKKVRPGDPDILPYAPRPRPSNALAGGVAAGAAAFPLMSLHQDAFGTYNTLHERVRGLQPDRLYFPDEMAASGVIQHGDVGTYFGEPQNIFSERKPNVSKLTQGGEWTSGSGTYHGMLLRPAMNNGKPDFQALEGGDAAWPGSEKADGQYTSPLHRFMLQRDKEDAAVGKIPQNEVGLLSAAKGAPNYNSHLDDISHTTSQGIFNRYFNAISNAAASDQPEAVAQMSFPQRMAYYMRQYKRQSDLVDQYRKQAPAEEMQSNYDFLSTRRHPMLVTRSPQITELLDSKKPGVADQTRTNIDTAFDKQYPMRPYNLGGAIAAGARRVFFPHVPQFGPTAPATTGGPDKVEPLPGPTCNEDFCVQPAGRVLNHHGVPVGVRPSMVLPADLAEIPSARPVGLMVPRPRQREMADLKLTGNPETDKPILDQYKRNYQSKIVNEWMPQSRNRRIMAGLAAAALMAGAGYGTTKFVQGKLRKRRRALQALKREEAQAKLMQQKMRKAAADQPYELSPFLLECIAKATHEK